MRCRTFLKQIVSRETICFIFNPNIPQNMVQNVSRETFFSSIFKKASNHAVHEVFKKNDVLHICLPDFFGIGFMRKLKYSPTSDFFEAKILNVLKKLNLEGVKLLTPAAIISHKIFGLVWLEQCVRIGIGFRVL